MLKIKGQFNTALVFTDNIDETAMEQIKTLCNMPYTKGAKIRIMPDVHAGAGCTIGTTMTISDTVVPNLVGVDIGCGLEVVQISNKKMDLEKLDRIIHARIPAGMNIRQKPHEYNDLIDLTQLHCFRHIDYHRAIHSIGTLGGGNHFIEADRDEEGHIYIVVHSGSRHLGNEVAKHYQDLAYKNLKGDEAIPRSLAYISGQLFEKYIHDMKIIQRYALLNRKAIMDTIIREMKLEPMEQFSTIHNYIDTESMILRKGAVSARKGEKLIIPINMRDGSLICIGKGNSDWNFSAPHGAGRLMSRKEARSTFSLPEFRKQMEGIYSSTINKDTLDECPMAYKDMNEIMEKIIPTVDIVKVIKPIYNFKAAE